MPLLTAFQKSVLNEWYNYDPALRKGQIGESNGGDLLIGDLLDGLDTRLLAEEASGSTASYAADGLVQKRVARATWDFSELGGATGSIPLGVTLPDNAIITHAYADVVTAAASAGGNGTIALSSEGAGDLLAAVDADTLSGQVDLVPDGTAANMIKLTADRELTVVVAVEDLTAGNIVFYVEYVQSA